MRDGNPARPPGQAWYPEHPSDPRGRTAGAKTAQARTGAEVALCVYLGARGTVQHGWVGPYGRAGRHRGETGLQGTSAHAEARLRLRFGQQGA